MYMNYRCHFGTSCGMLSAQQKSYEKGSNPSNARCVKEALQRRDQVKRQLRLIQQRIKALEEAVDEKKGQRASEFHEEGFRRCTGEYQGSDSLEVFFGESYSQPLTRDDHW